MAHTRRQFIRTAFTGVALLTAGKEGLALAADAPSTPSGPASAGTKAAGEWKTLKVADGGAMRAYVSRPEGTANKVPGVIVLQEIFGVNAHIRSVADRMAALGYVTIAPELFHRTAPGFESGYTDSQPGMEQMQKMTDAGTEADLKAAYEFLTRDAQVDASRIASVGYCMGGKVSFLANAVLPLKAAASYYGGGIAQSLLPRAAELHAPMLLFWGGKDTHIGRDKQNAVAAALKEAKKPYVDVEFSEAQHGFFCDLRDSYHPESARESWAIFTAFFREHLGS